MVRPCLPQALGVEDATRGLKQQFTLEAFLVRSWVSIRWLLWLVEWAFWWLNLWGEESFAEWRAALLRHPWRLRKAVTYLFDWVATMLRLLLHPTPTCHPTQGELQTKAVESGPGTANIITTGTLHAPIAQLDRASVYGTEG